MQLASPATQMGSFYNQPTVVFATSWWTTAEISPTNTALSFPDRGRLFISRF
ncbi:MULTISPECIES: hypothetical protein [unclassified Novosphingobium]|jgi:hypothetical protein|uniref:hypothetical protein n=1 Tax=unclassified Novosphingobium TaxID=2644732 RepID=UPI001ACDB5BE|nr:MULTISPECIES: hypothetical protein [unclassified Novosphingobium]MBN9144633.1 hypothetical protein [Novosphingobium sp.]